MSSAIGRSDRKGRWMSSAGMTVNISYNPSRIWSGHRFKHQLSYHRRDLNLPSLISCFLPIQPNPGNLLVVAILPKLTLRILPTQLLTLCTSPSDLLSRLSTLAPLAATGTPCSIGSSVRPTCGKETGRDCHRKRRYNSLSGGNRNKRGLSGMGLPGEGVPNPNVNGTLTDRLRGAELGSRPRVRRVYDC